MTTITLNYQFSKAFTFNLKNAAGAPLVVEDPHTLALVINSTDTWVGTYTPSQVVTADGKATLAVIIPSPEIINLSAIKKLPYCGIVHYELQLRHTSNTNVLLLEGNMNILHPGTS